ncbi:MAG: hypothetical protein RQ899_11135 [Pseudomonadales bacterium]|nr:hypothetical protein [Pseudomonadales bacterium]
MKKLILSGILLWPGLSGFSFSAEPEVEPQEETSEPSVAPVSEPEASATIPVTTPVTTQEEQEGAPPSDKDFVPSVQIVEDLPVAFPVDI